MTCWSEMFSSELQLSRLPEKEVPSIAIDTGQGVARADAETVLVVVSPKKRFVWEDIYKLG